MSKKKIILIGVLTVIISIFIVAIKYKFIASEVTKVSKENSNDILNGDITFVSNRTDKHLELEKLISEFEEKNPSVKVKLELLGDAEEILKRKASVGELPDVTLVPGMISASQYGHYFLEISDLNFSDDNMYNTYLGVGTDKKQYALTTSLSWFGVIYNKSVFEKCGITEIPNTLEELFADCEKINQNNITPFALNYKQSWIMNSWIEAIPYLFNVSLEDIIMKQGCEILGKDSEIYKSLDLAKNIYGNNYCEEDILNYDWAQCKNDIISGKTAMLIWNSDFTSQLEDLGMNPNDIGMFPVPGTKQISLAGDYMLAISKTTTHEKEAKAFLKFLIEDDRYAKAVNIMSSLKDSEKSKAFLEDMKSFNIPLVFQSDVLRDESKEDKERHEKFINLKNSLGLNYNFVQEYIISKSRDKLVCDKNKEYHNHMNHT